MNHKETIMHDEHESRLVQHWIVVTDDQGSEHLEARWVVEGELSTPVTHAA
jgi:hypothetical protein